MLFKIAFRNILRNRRRSLMTGSAIAVGAMAMLVFGCYISYIFAAFETGLVQRIGHLTVFRSGYFVFGAGNPAAYGIDDYQGVMTLDRRRSGAEADDPRADADPVGARHAGNPWLKGWHGNPPVRRKGRS